MIQLTDTETGLEVQAENEADAVKAMREAKRKAAAEEKRKANQARANERAEGAAYRLYYRTAAFDHKPEIIKPNGKDWQPRESIEAYWGNVHIRSIDGDAIYRYYLPSYRFIGVVWDGGGHHVGIVMRDNTTGEDYVHGIGVCEGEVSTALCPGLTASSFREEKERDE